MLATWGCTTFPKPTLSLDFLGATSLDSGITFSRGSQATLFDSTGTLVYAKQNLLLQSQALTTSPWITTSLSAVGSKIAPDGTATAIAITATGANGRTRQPVTVVAGQTYTHSMFVRRVTGSGNVTLAILDSGGTALFSTVLSLTSEWQRFTVSGAPAVTSILAGIIIATSTDAIEVWGAQLNTTPMEGGVTSSLTTYYPTTTAAYYAPRFDYNPSTLQPRGLLIEEQRTNLEPNSEALTSVLGASILTNVTTAPSGLVTADKLVEDTSTGGHQVATTSVSWVGNTAYTFTIFLKADTRTQVQIAFGTSTNWVAGQRNAQFDVLNGTVLGTAGANVTASIEAVGNGWYRCRMTCTTTATPVASTVQVQLYVGGTASYTGNGTSGLFFWGAQVEAGSFPTSYIPTSGTTLTRNADVATMTGTNFSSWYNASEGTFVAQYLPSVVAPATTGQVVFNTNDGTSLNAIQLSKRANVDASTRYTTDAGGSGQTFSNLGVFTATQTTTAVAYKENDFAGIKSGGSLVTDTLATVPTLNRMVIGADRLGGGSLNGTIQRLAYYPTRLPNTTLQALTA